MEHPKCGTIGRRNFDEWYCLRCFESYGFGPVAGDSGGFIDGGDYDEIKTILGERSKYRQPEPPRVPWSEAERAALEHWDGSLPPRDAVRRISLGDRAAQVLAERYPDGVIPRGELAEVSKEVGISLKLLREAAQANGFKIGQPRRSIRALLERWYPDGVVPLGGLTQLARDEGYNPVSVQNEARVLGYKVDRKKRFA